MSATMGQLFLHCLLGFFVQFYEVNDIPYSVLLSYWRKRISITLMNYNAWIINQANVFLNNNGGRYMYRDFDLPRVD